MTCRDIIVSKLKELGADGLIISGPWIKCHCTLADIGRDSNTCGFDCTPAKLINGKWEAVEEKVEDKEYCEWECIDINYYSTSCGCKIHTYEIITDKNTVCPVCNKRVREVKP